MLTLLLKSIINSGIIVNRLSDQKDPQLLQEIGDLSLWLEWHDEQQRPFILLTLQAFYFTFEKDCSMLNSFLLSLLLSDALEH
jgi:hypothetical protein